MDYKHWTDKLTDEEFEEWEVEMLMCAYLEDDTRTLTEEYNSFEDFIGDSFDWYKTKKGSGYWSRLGKENR